MTPLKRGNIYYAVWTCIPGRCPVHPVQKRHWASLGTGDKREAKRLCSELETKLQEDKARVKLGLPLVRRASMTLGQFRDQYLDSTSHDKAASTHLVERYHLDTLVQHFGEGCTLDGLTQDALEGYKRHRLKTVAPRTWNSTLASLKAIFAWGLRREPALYDKNPFSSITRVDKGEPTREKFVSRGDIKKAMQAARPFWQNVIAFLYCGMCRGSELRGLKWSDIDFENSRITFRKTKERKTKAIPIIPVLRSVLESAKRYSGTSEYVFPGPDGHEIKKDLLHHTLQRIGKRVNVKLSPHMLRHSGITTALGKGVPLFAVQKQAGHSQVTTTQGYTHLGMESQVGVMEALGVDEIYVANE